MRATPTPPTTPPVDGEPADAAATTAEEHRPDATSRPTSRVARTWLRVRIPLLLLALVALSVIALVLATPQAKSNSYLDPADASSTGTKALAVILTQRGYHLAAVYSPAAALHAIGTAAGPASATLVITSPDLLTKAQLRQLAIVDADLVLVEPESPALRILAPGVQVASPAAPFYRSVKPSCSLAGAELAGSAQAGGITYRTAISATGCYPIHGHPSVLRYQSRDRSGHRTVTILGNGLFLSDELLGGEGNSALALNLLNAHHSIVWLTPEPTVAARSQPVQTPRSKPELIPGVAWLVVLQLFVALLLTALWRMRRLGPLITEHLPVVVRASETVEGHARLYQSRRARARAASALRSAMIERVKPVLGLGPDAPPDAVVDGLAGRSTLRRQQIASIGYGPPPGTDAELVALVDDLDELEREVRSQ
jgi:uncharacterized protein DUF4350